MALMAQSALFNPHNIFQNIARE